MTQPLNWGLLSTARINRALIKPLHKSKRTRLLAVASRSLDSAEAYAREWKIPRALGSYEALLADPEIDVIYNSLPNHMHAEWTVRALRAGKHVLCEKPMALSLAEMDGILSAANETGKMVAEAFMYRHHPQTLKAQEIVASGALGKLQFIRGAFSYIITRLDSYRLDARMGGGSIWDVGCYPISYARTLVGAEPLEVFGWQVQGPSGIDETFVGQMRFEGGIHAQIDCGFKFPSRSYMEIVGSEAVLHVASPYKPGRREQITLTRGDQVEKIRIFSSTDLYMGEVDDLCDAILFGRSPRITLADSRANLAAILALLESARSGRPVSL
ncbi:MAG: Gfo/Idh/MocA family oxidoreductase [Chloroflexi bacterium]|nr:Gfo/Idh/MocA family oxidoreductase [Chloroflexota bacterium]